VTQGARRLEHVPFDEAMRSQIDCAIVATDHAQFDYRQIAELPLVVDTRNALKSLDRSTIFRL
jgi:UDP-N-acetyl-D-mannosaminuronate dehydrogenase